MKLYYVNYKKAVLVGTEKDKMPSVVELRRGKQIITYIRADLT